MYKYIGLIPARSGSVRIPNKNMYVLGGKTLIARSVIAARKSLSLDLVYICTDSIEYEAEAIRFGSRSTGIRPKEFATPTSPDIDWIKWSLAQLHDTLERESITHIVILRPTSPFRTSEFIDRAIKYYQEYANGPCVSLRCVSRSKEHPGKMWIRNGASPFMRPLIPLELNDIPFSDNQTASLFEVYTQNAALEIIPIEGLMAHHMPISGFSTLLFEANDEQVFDINIPEDLDVARLIAEEKNNG